MKYKVELKAILRPLLPLTSDEQATVIADLCALLRRYGGAGGGRLLEITAGVKEADNG